MSAAEQQKPSITQEEFNSCLKAVFGAEIFQDTQAARWHREYHAARNPSFETSIWPLYYNGKNACLNAYLPRVRRIEITDSLRGSLRYAIEDAKRRGIAPELLPTAEEVISREAWIEAEPLQRLAAQGVTLHFTARDVIGRAVKHEENWVKFQKQVVEDADRLVLGVEPDAVSKNDLPPHFRFDSNSYAYDAEVYELKLLLALPIGLKRRADVAPDISDYFLCRKAEGIFNARSRELGVSHLFTYESFHYGTHAPIDEERLIMKAYSAEEMHVKLAELARPETLEKVRTLFREVVREVSAGYVILGNSPAFRAALDEIVPQWKSGDKETYREWGNRRMAAADELDKIEPHASWREQADAFSEGDKTVGDWLDYLKNPPEDKRETCDKMRDHLLNGLPLLASEFARPQP